MPSFVVTIIRRSASIEFALVPDRWRYVRENGEGRRRERTDGLPVLYVNNRRFLEEVADDVRLAGLKAKLNVYHLDGGIATVISAASALMDSGAAMPEWMKSVSLPALACSAGVGSSRILFVRVFFVEAALAEVIAVRVVVNAAFFGFAGFDVDDVEVAGI